jgi:hypothetical protein
MVITRLGPEWLVWRPFGHVLCGTEFLKEAAPLLISTGEDPRELGIDDFTRRFALRAANLMCFLGAGASASAGIPTAQDMVWEFKQLLFVSQRRVAPQTVADLSNPAIRAQVQAHIDAAMSRARRRGSWPRYSQMAT